MALDVLDLPFLVIFTVESGLRAIAMGLIGWNGAYLSDPLGWLDTLVVITGWLTIDKGPLAHLSGIRALRIFRALRALNMAAIPPGTVFRGCCIGTYHHLISFRKPKLDFTDPLCFLYAVALTTL
jgi:hypothetical protein